MCVCKYVCIGMCVCMHVCMYVSKFVCMYVLQVSQAQATIHEEVSSVRMNIAQYVTITNQQFASENDFVKYQLAGVYVCMYVCMYV